MKTSKLKEILKALHEGDVYVQLNGVYYPITDIDLTDSYVVLKAKDIVVREK